MNPEQEATRRKPAGLAFLHYFEKIILIDMEGG